jgi:hypothetical protein
MRTKTLLLTAALSAAGIATSMAQAVYSVNAVGYVNTPLVKGYNLISNPLNNTAQNGNQIQNLFASLPPGSQIFKFNGTRYDLAEVDIFSGQVTGPAATMTVVPGEGVFVNIPSDAPANTTITFVGEVMQGTGANQLSYPIPAGFSIRSSQVPQAGTATQLNFPAGEQDQVFVFNEATQKYGTHQYLFGAWDPTEPSIDVGEAVFVNNAGAAKNWTRSFSVNP